MSPAKNVTRRPRHVIEEAVKRYMAGESVSVLAKYYKISKPGFYLWIAKVKQEMLDEAAREGIAPSDQEKIDKRVLIVELEAMKQENAKLRNKVISLMLKAKEM